MSTGHKNSDVNTKITFLGCGSMNEAILGGILAGGLPAAQVTATVRRPERAEELRNRHGITVLSNNEDAHANRKAVAEAGVVILGVKPVGIVDLCRDIADSLSKETVVLSVAAAVSLELLEGALNEGQPVVRTMPNTPSRVGRGVVSVSAGSACSREQLDRAIDALKPTGTVVEIPEEQVDALSAVSGSGPAYAFYLAEHMANAGIALGLDDELARTIARETVAGAGYMLAEDGVDAATLRRNVTSPNGTTEQAIKTFDAKGMPDIIEAGARNAAARAAEITAELKAKG